MKYINNNWKKKRKFIAQIILSVEVLEGFRFINHCFESVEYFQWIRYNLIAWQNEAIPTCYNVKRNCTWVMCVYLVANFHISACTFVTKLKCVCEWDISGSINPIYTASRSQIWIKQKIKELNRQCKARMTTSIANTLNLTYKLCLQYYRPCIRFHIDWEWLLLLSIQFFAAIRQHWKQISVWNNSNLVPKITYQIIVVWSVLVRMTLKRNSEKVEISHRLTLYSPKINLQMGKVRADCTHGMRGTVLYYRKFWWNRLTNGFPVPKRASARRKFRCTDFSMILRLKFHKFTKIKSINFLKELPWC